MASSYEQYVAAATAAGKTPLPQFVLAGSYREDSFQVMQLSESGPVPIYTVAAFPAWDNGPAPLAEASKRIAWAEANLPWPIK